MDKIKKLSNQKDGFENFTNEEIILRLEQLF
jgi:hypothetical protein